MIKDTLTQDLKAALLAKDADLVSVLRGIKSVILDAEIAQGARESGLSDEAIVAVLQKQAKQRQDSADIYLKAGEAERAEKELAEKKIIERYLPEQLSEDEIAKLVDETIAQLGVQGPQAMGQVIGAVKTKSKGAADGSLIARIAKEKLQP